MAAMEQSGLQQWAVLFPFTGYDSHGQATVGPGVEVRVRFNTVRREVVDAKGNSIALDGQAVVDRPVRIDSHFWIGRLAAYNAGPDDAELMVVKTYSETPDIKNRFTTKTCGLMRLHSRGTN